MLGLCGKAWPATFHVLAIGLAKTARRLDLATLETTALAIAALVEGQQHLAGEARTLLEDRRHHVGRDIIPRGKAGIVARVVEQFVHHEAHVAQRGLIVGHGALLDSVAAPAMDLARTHFQTCV